MRNYEHGPHRKNSDEGRLAKVSGPLLVRRFSVRQPEMFRVIEEVLAKKLTTLDKASLCELAQTAMDIESGNLEGDFLQAGGSAGTVTVLENSKRRNRVLTVCEPPYEKTVPEGGEWALAYLDCGEYEPMRVLLERLTPRLVPGGHIVVERYRSSDCRKAVDEYFLGRKGFQLLRMGRLHIIKN